MSKLHMYQKIGKYCTSVADGDGELSNNKEFNVLITAGGVAKGKVYEIKKGMSLTGDRYNCVKAHDGEATFRHQFNFSSMGEKFQNNAASFSLRSAVKATEKTVTIQIDGGDLNILKGSDYKLCFAKKVNEYDYNIVWQSYTKYLQNNTFSWTPQYQLFGINQFQDNITVRASTNVVTIGLGEISILDSVGNLSEASTGGDPNSLNLDNEYGSIHPGVNQVSTGIDGLQVSTPIYVAVKPVVRGITQMRPIEKILVWFEQDIETGTMFSTSRSSSIEIDLTNEKEATRLYKGQNWSTP